MLNPANDNSRTAWWICLGAIAILFLNAARSVPQIADLLISGDGDDLTRLQQVRDWLGGQSWFDTQQYRILPPDGISIHWSRYIDIGIAAFLIPASWLLPATQAEYAAIILWPTFVGCLAVLIIGRGANRLMGPAGAIGALVVFLSWSKFGGEFAAGRIDHHNMQLLCASAVIFLSVVPGRKLILGALAGLATALSLAIGLEMLPFLAVNWGLMILRHAFDEDGIDKWLVGFCASLAVTAPLLFAGQTAPANWLVNHCDVLAPPIFSLAAVGIAASLGPVLLGKLLPHPMARILLAAALAGSGLWLASGLLVPCLAGPYANAAPEVRLIIETRVTEALSAATLLQTRPELLLRVLLPPVIISVLALVAIALMRGRIGRVLGIALMQSFVVVLVGLVFALVQIRAANLITPAIPVLAGFLGYAFVQIPRNHRLRAPAAIGLVLAMPAVVEPASRLLVGPLKLSASMDSGTTATDYFGYASIAYCQDRDAIGEIASLPKSVIFSTLNLGPAILVYTQHAITSAGYHRSAEAFSNGVIAFQSRNDLRDGLAKSNANYMVVCTGAGEEQAVKRLEGADWPAWLVEVTGERQHVRVFQVDKTALSNETGTP